MPDITLSPIPYNGGTLAMTNVNSHICHLSGNRFFALFSQATPNYLIASTFDVDLTTASAAVPVKQRVVDTVAPTRIRVWKLSATKVLALVGTDLVVFSVAADGDITKTTATMPNVHATVLWGAESATAAGIGPMLQGFSMKDNVVWFIQRTSTTSAIKLFKIVHDAGANTLTKTELLTLAASTTATHLWRGVVQPIPGTTSVLVFAHGGNTAWTSSPITAYHVLTDGGVVLQSVTTGIPSNVRFLCALTVNRILGFVKTNTWTMWDGSVWNAESYFAAAAGASSTMLTAIPLDGYHFMLMSTTSSAEMGGAAQSLRVSRILDPLFGQTSDSTNAGSGLAVTNTGTYFDQQVLQQTEDGKFFNVARPTTASFRVRAFYAA